MPQHLTVNDVGTGGTGSSFDDEFYSGPTGYTWVNQGNASASVINGWLTIQIPGIASNDTVKALVKAVPSSTWTVEARMTLWTNTTASNQYAGLVVRNSTTGRQIEFGLAYITSVSRLGVFVDRNTSPTSFLDTVVAAGTNPVLPPSIGTPMYFRIQWDAVNLSFSYSFEGSLWTQVYSEAPSTFINAAGGSISHIGIAAFNASSSGTLKASFDYLRKVA